VGTVWTDITVPEHLSSVTPEVEAGMLAVMLISSCTPRADMPTFCAAQRNLNFRYLKRYLLNIVAIATDRTPKAVFEGTKAKRFVGVVGMAEERRTFPRRTVESAEDARVASKASDWVILMTLTGDLFWRTRRAPRFLLREGIVHRAEKSKILSKVIYET